MIGITFALLASSTAFSLAPPKGSPRFRWLQEAEKKHSRVALLAAPSLAAIAMATGEDPVPWLNHQPLGEQILFYSSAGILESINLRRLAKGFTLKDEEEPGRVFATNASALPNLNFIEDTAGRACMLGVAGTLLASATQSVA